MNPIQSRIIAALHSGHTLSVKNMYSIKVTNISREIRRNFEIPFGITLERKTIKWKDKYSDGYYFEYRLNPKDRSKLHDLYLQVLSNYQNQTNGSINQNPK